MIAKSNSRQQIDDYKQTVVRKGPDNRLITIMKERWNMVVKNL